MPEIKKAKNSDWTEQIIQEDLSSLLQAKEALVNESVDDMIPEIGLTVSEAALEYLEHIM